MIGFRLSFRTNEELSMLGKQCYSISWRAYGQRCLSRCLRTRFSLWLYPLPPQLAVVGVMQCTTPIPLSFQGLQEQQQQRTAWHKVRRPSGHSPHPVTDRWELIRHGFLTLTQGHSTSESPGLAKATVESTPSSPFVPAHPDFPFLLSLSVDLQASP